MADKLARQYAKDKKVTDTIYGSNSEKARRNGWQYENGEKNHHKRGVPVRTNDAEGSAYVRNNDVIRDGKRIKYK